MDDKSVRRLTALEKSASTARVLNLVMVHRKFPNLADLQTSPFFQNRVLDRCIILKHRLRPHEMDMFEAYRPQATKILVPIDSADLKVGARYIFVGQKNFNAVSESVFGRDLYPGARDRVVLDLIDELPSLDPFLLREHLRRNEIMPAREYFAISEADVLRMHDYVRREVSSLVQMSAKDSAQGPLPAERLVEKLLSTTPEADFGPLKAVLRLSDKDYHDGIFAWRGFLYYKWVLSEISKDVQDAITGIRTIQPRGPRDPEASAYITATRSRIGPAIQEILRQTRDTLTLYDDAYGLLTQQGNPVGFRDFLISAPAMFQRLGEQMGVLQHIMSFWRYRFGAAKAAPASPAELMDILMDFEDSLTYEGVPA